jgi:hypothetical protein
MRYLLAALLLGGCSSKEARRPALTLAPLIVDGSSGSKSPLLQAGELVEVVRPAGTRAWHGTLDGKPATRDGDLLEVRRAKGDGPAWAFASDLGPEAKVDPAESVCAKIADPAAPPDQAGCARRLRRIQLASGLLAFDPCAAGTCRAGLIQGDTTTTMAIEGLSDLAIREVEGQKVAVAESHWQRDPKWNGVSTVVLRLAPRFDKALDIVTDETDTRSAPPIQRSGDLTFDAQGIRFVGSRREIAPWNGALLHEQKIDERYHLAAVK